MADSRSSQLPFQKAIFHFFDDHVGVCEVRLGLGSYALHPSIQPRPLGRVELEAARLGLSQFADGEKIGDGNLVCASKVAVSAKEIGLHVT